VPVEERLANIGLRVPVGINDARVHARNIITAQGRMNDIAQGRSLSWNRRQSAFRYAVDEAAEALAKKWRL
jgi:hypothetical protein